MGFEPAEKSEFERRRRHDDIVWDSSGINLTLCQVFKNWRKPVRADPRMRPGGANLRGRAVACTRGCAGGDAGHDGGCRRGIDAFVTYTQRYGRTSALRVRTEAENEKEEL
ncbi:hypothetical protein HJC23_005010 [Cyclotella cryptica]|uniref:Uncharacterized protein n=1 Tax=Cyclotella cryptica TaxID=29204 RepID=A0ABD3QDB6_9STRA